MSMETSHSRQEHKKSMAMAMKVPQLLTPEEHIEDTFNSRYTVKSFQATVPSPPASPEFRSFSSETSFPTKDDVLYPDNNSANTPSDQLPLFESVKRLETPVRQRSPSTENSLSIATPSTLHESPPSKAAAYSDLPRLESRQTSEPVPANPVALAAHYGYDYWRFCRSQYDEYRQSKMEERILPPPTASRRATRDGYTERVISSLGRSYRIEKPVATHQSSTRPKTARTTAVKASARSVTPSATVVKHESSAKRHRRQTSTAESSSGASLHNIAQPKPRTRAAPTKKIDDTTDWRQIPDFCPPLSTLEKPGRVLSVNWTNNNELNLDDDPDKKELHPQELKLAATLRLKCNSYLANKRRIFKGKVDALKESKDFNKTSAQNVTNIDVNKASRLWTAFDQAGWFEEDLFQQHL